MKIAILAPYYKSKNRGNAVAVHRWVKGLLELGEDVRAFSLESPKDWPEIKKNLFYFHPDIIHAVHGFRAGQYLVELPPIFNAPFVVSLRGTDLWNDLVDPERGKVIESALRISSRITVLTEEMKQVVVKQFPDLCGNIVVIPQGVEKLTVDPVFSFGHGILPSDRVILFPANIRGVKNILYPLDPLVHLVKDFPDLKLAYVGPVLDNDIKKRFDMALSAYPWGVYLGVVKHEEMGSLFANAFAVINCSTYEGMSNALLEGMSMGKPVFAYRNDASIELIKDGKTGFLFGSPKELFEKMKQLLLRSDLAEQIGQAAQSEVLQNYSAEKEVKSYQHLYHTIFPL